MSATDLLDRRARARERLRLWRANNRERYNASARKLREKNRDRVKASYNKWRESHLEQERARGRAYIAANREKIRARDRAKYAENREKHHIKNCRYYAAHADRRKAERKAWAQENPEKARALVRRRRARRMAAGGSHTIEDIRLIRAAQHNRCAGCTKKLGTEYQVDHIIPLSKGGSDDRRNLQLLCGLCNRRKKDLDPAVFYRRQGRLL